MKNSVNKDLKEESQLFMFDDDFANETAIYSEIASEAFKSEIGFVMGDSNSGKILNSDFYWEESDEFEIYN
jgi:hypothetical protein